MMVTLFAIGTIIFLGAIFDFSLATLRDKVDINVYFVTSAPEEEVLRFFQKFPQFLMRLEKLHLPTLKSDTRMTSLLCRR
jgi:hypothetical protein